MWAKLEAMSEGARLASEGLWGHSERPRFTHAAQGQP
jgi:hypothetical protein